MPHRNSSGQFVKQTRYHQTNKRHAVKFTTKDGKTVYFRTKKRKR